MADFNNIVSLHGGGYFDLAVQKVVDIGNIPITNFRKEIELIYGLDSAKIDLKLYNQGGQFITKDGYLIEVFLSNSDGLVRMQQNTIIDPITQDTEEEGYGEYFLLKVDV